MESKIPPEVMAEMFGISVKQVNEVKEIKELSMETAIEILNKFGVSWQNRDPLEALDEFFRSLEARLKSLSDDPDRDLLVHFQDLVEHSQYEKNWLVFEGDWGGQIYLTVPWALVGKKAKLIKLMNFVDSRGWRELEGATLYLHSPEETAQILAQAEPDEEFSEDQVPDDHVLGGMGGGQLLPDDLWIHPDLAEEHPCIRVSVSKLLDLK